MKTKQTALAGLLVLGLSACGTMEIEEVRTVEPAGADFNKALTREYQELSRFEADEMFDFIDAAEYARKGLAAARGEAVLPFELKDWNLPEDKIGELAEARATLMDLFDKGARERLPAAAADAQGKFDCWVEQQEENHQFDHIAACREAFYAAIDILKEEPEAASPAKAPSKFYVMFFGWDEDELDRAGYRVLDTVLEALAHYKTDATIVGHADTSGSKAYNDKLSERRALNVREALVGDGVDAGRLTTTHRGEADLAVPTDDGVKMRANRRATVIID